MKDRDAARAYLKEALAAAGTSMAAASRAIGRNHAYLEQYIRRGKPMWLAEVDRLALVREWPSIDAERLKPKPRLTAPAPSRRLSAHRGHQPQIDAPRLAQLIQQPGALDLLEAFAEIRQQGLRELALKVIRGMADTESSVAG